MWNTETEIQFLKESLKSFAPPEQLFYKLTGGYFAYIPKGSNAEGQTLQSRNSLIGQFTENWAKNLLSPIAKAFKLYAVNGVVCEELGLTRQSSADVAFCTKDGVNQNANDIKLLFEVKMSVVSNYRYEKKTNTISLLGDYKTHKGNPSLLRSDSMLKAIGKSINIRVSGISATKIPIVVLGNSPITDSYVGKVDFLKTSGVIQGFISLNPSPTKADFIKSSPKLGFQTVSDSRQLQNILSAFIKEELNFFSSMITKVNLGEIISIAAKEKTDIQKAEKFLSLIRS
ncbi:MAG: hypothetical protein QME58_01020 [Bacteroidota bacterium]|nr:hypothetical protein [Bacteroidota bacterium]